LKKPKLLAAALHYKGLDNKPIKEADSSIQFPLSRLLNVKVKEITTVKDGKIKIKFVRGSVATGSR